MTKPNQTLMKVALAVHEQVTEQSVQPPALQLPLESWAACEDTIRRIRRARENGWNLAARRLQRHLQDQLWRLRSDVSSVFAILDPPRSNNRSITAADVHADLVALYEEFDDVSIDRQAKTMSVTTEPIQLEDVHLGPFDIRLDWSNLENHPDNYRVIAIDPNPAARDDTVTHPHVQSDLVCEGEGRRPICTALAQGRLLDFFQIVANLLRTYNSGSPYIALSEWCGEQCADCGSSVTDEERYGCEQCGTAMCGDCSLRCGDCNSSFCDTCSSPCEDCGESHCEGCLQGCLGCEDKICHNCLDHNERCSHCHVEEPSDSTKETNVCLEAGVSRDANVTLQSDCLGEAAFHA